jgi:hypothetical protein
MDECVGKLAIVRGDREVFDELGDEECIEAVLDRSVANGDREVSLRAATAAIESS